MSTRFVNTEIPVGVLMAHTFSRRSTGKISGINGILKR